MRLKPKTNTTPIRTNPQVNSSWEKLKRSIKEAATEALKTRKIKWGKKIPNKTPWFCKRKKTAYLKYKTTKTSEDYQEYKRIRNITNRPIKNRHWEVFSKRIDSSDRSGG